MERESNTEQEIFKKFFCELAIINLKIREKCELSEEQIRMYESLKYMIPIIYKFKENPNISIDKIIDLKEKEKLFEYSEQITKSTLKKNKLKNISDTIENYVVNKHTNDLPVHRTVNFNGRTYQINNTSSYNTSNYRYNFKEEDTNTDEITSDEEGDELVEKFTEESIIYLNDKRNKGWVTIEEYSESDEESFDSEYSEISSNEETENEYSEDIKITYGNYNFQVLST